MKKFSISIIIAAIIIGAGTIISAIIISNNSMKSLPRPELSEGQRGELGIDKNINEQTIDDYLGRTDSVYYDMRMLDDPAAYEAIGGDRLLSGYIKGFETVPYPYLSQVKGLPEAVGAGYDGPKLFNQHDDGSYTANYQESDQIISDLFPTDKYIFLMCGGGGYAGMTKKLLIAKGYDADKIYVVGGFWYYTGKNKIEIKETDSYGKTIYAFWKIPYHDINFNTLTKI